MKGDSPSAILHDLECFRQMGSVLYIAAHPDDENTELLAYLSRGRDYRTAYLSLTRGDGGQNVLGPDLGERMGVARTQELLAARRIDGAHQYFSRAIDFGFSKNYMETLRVWDKNEVLSDMVRVIREFRPDVLITRFSPSPGGTHGHHTASAVLALEAFKMAGDPKAFPEQKLAPWQPKRIFWNISVFQKDKAVGLDAIKIDVSGKDSVSGDSFAHIAEKSRAMHKTQGFDTWKINGNIEGARMESFHHLDGESATKDILGGIDTTWNRVPGGAEIGKGVDDVIAHFDAKDVAASVPALLKLRSQLSLLKSSDPVVKEKREQLDRILQECLGLNVQTTLSHTDFVPGESIKLHHSASITSKVPVRWIATKYPLTNREVKKAIDLHVGKDSTRDEVEKLPTTTPLTQPWWLRLEGTAGMFKTDQPDLIGTAENAPSFPVEDIFEVGGQTLVVADEPVQIAVGALGSPTRHRMNVIPPVSLSFNTEVTLFTPGASRSVNVDVTAARADTHGSLKLESPEGWKVAPEAHTFNLNKVGDHTTIKFTLTAPKRAEIAKITASAEVQGVQYRSQHYEVKYPHVPPQLLQSPAVLKAVSVDVLTKAHVVGYLPGAGDSLPENLQQLGCTVKMLDDATLTLQQLQGLNAVVLGVRALNVRKNMDAAMPILFDYVKDGGTVIVQYNRADGLKTTKIAPYDLHLSTDRVTDETATMTVLEPDSPILNNPNKITQSDFGGWVQERGLYFPNQWDDHFTPILSCNDPDEKPMKGSLLVADYGKGHFIYTGLSLFRQLPAGVPGAYRLLANMLSVGTH